MRDDLLYPSSFGTSQTCFIETCNPFFAATPDHFINQAPGQLVPDFHFKFAIPSMLVLICSHVILLFTTASVEGPKQGLAL